MAKDEFETTMGKNPDANGEENKKDETKPNIFVRAWRGAKRFGEKIVNVVREHPKAAIVTINTLGVAAGVAGKVVYDSLKSTSKVYDTEMLPEYEPEMIEGDETEDIEAEYPIEETIETAENEE